MELWKLSDQESFSQSCTGKLCLGEGVGDHYDENPFPINAMVITISIIVILTFTNTLFSSVDHITTGTKQRKSDPDLELPTGGGGDLLSCMSWNSVLVLCCC